MPESHGRAPTEKVVEVRPRADPVATVWSAVRHEAGAPRSGWCRSW